MKSLFDAIADRPRSHRIFLASAIVAIALGTVWSFVVGPALFEREEIQAEVISNNAFIAAKRAIASRLESAQKEASIAEVAAQRPQGNFRAPPEIDNLLEQVSAVAGEIGLDLELFQRKEERMRDFYAEVPTAVAISGGFHDIAVFIDRVSRLPGLLTFERFSLSRAAQGISDDKLQGDFILVAYRLLSEDERKARLSTTKKR